MQSDPNDNNTTLPVIITPSDPSTPPRGRKYTRYPSSLAVGDPGRVPLHRRGTSKTYERLEDLLKEAGYKETRIFTPEAERAEAKSRERAGHDDGQSVSSATGRSGVGAVVDFLTGWMPGATRHDEGQVTESESGGDDSQAWQRSLPASPLAHKRPLPSDSESSLASPPTPGHRTLQLLHSHHLLPHANPRGLPHQPSSAGNLRTYAQVSAARASLRHMASAPNMAKPRGRGDVPHTAPPVPGAPPLPSKWLESVTKAVLGSTNSEAHIGGPQPPRPVSRHSHRTYRSTAQGSALSDRTNRRPRPLALNRESSATTPPALSALLHPAQTATLSVTAARVVCRSAPASRSSSRAGERLAMASDLWLRSAKHSGSDVVPSLTSTRLENDEVWTMHWKDGVRGYHNASDDEDYDHDDDDEGEIDLARLLVPPKRQHSIRSLRQHLHRSESARAMYGADHRSLDPWASEEEDAGASRRQMSSLRSRSKRNSLDDDEHGHRHGWEALGVPGFDQVGSKRRRGIPAWSGGGNGKA